jgi:hypothetical protein
MKHQKRVDWVKLDNASKLFPAVRSNRDTKVFRLHCELTEVVDPFVLQQALNKAIESFPLFRSVLRRGVFWYYLEDSDIEPVVELESNPVCAPIYFGDRRNLLFRVFFYHERINLEVFHALADGSGAISFMEVLVYEYLIRKHSGEGLAATPLFRPKAAVSKKMDNSFEKYFAGGRVLRRRLKRKDQKQYGKAHRLKGVRLPENRTRLIEGSMSVRAVLDLAHEYKTTMTIFLASLWMCSINREMTDHMRKYPVVLSVPVDLRNFFESVTARNFFSTMTVGYHFKDPNPPLQDVVDELTEAFRTNLNEEWIKEQAGVLLALEQHPVLRVLPLPLKDLSLRIAVRISDRKITSSISNLGRISMPSEFDPFIRQFGVSTGAKRPQLTICSYLDRLVISATSPFADADIQRTFFQFLSERGVDVEIASNS